MFLEVVLEFFGAFSTSGSFAVVLGAFSASGSFAFSFHTVVNAYP